MDDIIRSREIIKSKYNALRRGKEETTKALQKIFKPVADPLKAILESKDSPVQRSLLPIKKEEDPQPPPAKKEKMDDPPSKNEASHSMDVTSAGKEEQQASDDEPTTSDLEEELDWEDAREDSTEDISDHDDRTLLESYVNSQFGPLSSSYFREMIVNNDTFEIGRASCRERV